VQRQSSSSLAACVLALTVWLGAACATEPTRVLWTKEGATKADLDAAREACLADPEVMGSVGEGSRAAGTAAKLGWARFERCMRERGWEATSEQPGRAGS